MMRRTMPIRKRATAPRTWRGAYVTLTAAPAGRAQAWGAEEAIARAAPGAPARGPPPTAKDDPRACSRRTDGTRLAGRRNY